MKHDAQWHVPSYAQWCEDEDPVPAYRHMANLLRLIGWSQQESSLRPWILKTPQHMLDLPALLEVFPDARLIFTHRDPKQFVASAASLSLTKAGAQEAPGTGGLEAGCPRDAAVGSSSHALRHAADWPWVE